MSSHPVDIYAYYCSNVNTFMPNLCVAVAMALVRLSERAGFTCSLLLVYMIHTIISGSLTESQ